MKDFLKDLLKIIPYLIIFTLATNSKNLLCDVFISFGIEDLSPREPLGFLILILFLLFEIGSLILLVKVESAIETKQRKKEEEENNECCSSKSNER